MSNQNSTTLDHDFSKWVITTFHFFEPKFHHVSSLLVCDIESRFTTPFKFTFSAVQEVKDGPRKGASRKEPFSIERLKKIMLGTFWYIYLHYIYKSLVIPTMLYGQSIWVSTFCIIIFYFQFKISTLNRYLHWWSELRTWMMTRDH